MIREMERFEQDQTARISVLPHVGWAGWEVGATEGGGHGRHDIMSICKSARLRFWEGNQNVEKSLLSYLSRD